MAKGSPTFVARDKSMFRGSKTVADDRDLPDDSGSVRDAREAILQIENIVAQYSTGGEAHRYHSVDAHGRCSVCNGPRSLPSRLLIHAAKTATKINPVNAPAFWRKSALNRGFVPEPENISALTSKYWGPKPRELSVSFLDSPSKDLKDRILSHMNAWTKTGCISFVETSGAGQVRISRGQGGYWSYLGTDILHIPPSHQTMNLEGFTMNTPESEYKRVVRHETGHTLGFPHEHMRQDIIARIDRTKIYDYASRTFGWDRQTVDEQILTPIEESSLLSTSTKADQHSIMCYQLPASVTLDGLPIVGGSDIDESDYEFCGLIYPKATRADTSASTPIEDGAWPATEDILEAV